jgi:hypothetical protein
MAGDGNNGMLEHRNGGKVYFADSHPRRRLKIRPLEVGPVADRRSMCKCLGFGDVDRLGAAAEVRCELREDKMNSDEWRGSNQRAKRFQQKATEITEKF